MQDQAKNNNIDLDKTKTKPEVAKYTEHMKDWSNQPYPVLATALWAIEYSYYKASSKLFPWVMKELFYVVIHTTFPPLGIKWQISPAALFGIQLQRAFLLSQERSSSRKNLISSHLQLHIYPDCISFSSQGQPLSLCRLVNKVHGSSKFSLNFTSDLANLGFPYSCQNIDLHVYNRKLQDREGKGGWGLWVGGGGGGAVLHFLLHFASCYLKTYIEQHLIRKLQQNIPATEYPGNHSMSWRRPSYIVHEENKDRLLAVDRSGRRLQNSRAHTKSWRTVGATKKLVTI